MLLIILFIRETLHLWVIILFLLLTNDDLLLCSLRLAWIIVLIHILLVLSTCSHDFSFIDVSIDLKLLVLALRLLDLLHLVRLDRENFALWVLIQHFNKKVGKFKCIMQVLLMVRSRFIIDYSDLCDFTEIMIENVLLEDGRILLVLLISWTCHVSDNVEELGQELEARVEDLGLTVSLFLLIDFWVECRIQELEVAQLERCTNCGYVDVQWDFWYIKLLEFRLWKVKEVLLVL